MPFQDFREFLGALRKHGELIDIDLPVALELKVADVPGWKDYDFPELRKRGAT